MDSEIDVTAEPTPVEDSALGERIKELREAAGLTHAEVAERAGISRSYVTRLEAGKVGLPSRGVLPRLAEALDTTREDLLRAAGFLEQLPMILDDPALEIAFRHVETLPPEDRQEVLEFVSYVMYRRRRRGATGEGGTESP